MRVCITNVHTYTHTIPSKEIFPVDFLPNNLRVNRLQLLKEFPIKVTTNRFTCVHVSPRVESSRAVSKIRDTTNSDLSFRKLSGE